MPTDAIYNLALIQQPNRVLLIAVPVEIGADKPWLGFPYANVQILLSTLRHVLPDLAPPSGLAGNIRPLEIGRPYPIGVVPLTQGQIGSLLLQPM
jgi:hypothetical protein